MQTTELQAKNTDLVLIGGGHSHLTVIKQLAMNPIAGLRVTVISKDIHTPYSGMLPGLIAGHYSIDEAHIDLRALFQSADIGLFQAEVCKLDLEKKIIHCIDRSVIRYDYLSINSGSQPALHSIPGANTIGIGVKPVRDFLDGWSTVQQQIITETNSFHLAVVGGGAASVEVALACQYRLGKEMGEDIRLKLKITIYCNDNTLLISHNRQVQKRFNTILAERGIEIKLNHRVTSATQTSKNKQLQFVDQTAIEADEIIWAIHAGSPTWAKESGLECDNNGFISVNQYLQSSSHKNVFAAGDVAHFLPQSLAKSGVYSVRAGKQLSNNLRSYMTDKPLEPFIPQKRFLSLLMTGDKQAVASKGRFCVSGAWVWRWKDSIDRRFMAKFQLPFDDVR
jgi:selenide,water dikinase